MKSEYLEIFERTYLKVPEDCSYRKGLNLTLVAVLRSYGRCYREEGNVDILCIKQFQNNLIILIQNQSHMS